jgi:ribosomal protein S18 acetylase RimI-like enzyme
MNLSLDIEIREAITEDAPGIARLNQAVQRIHAEAHPDIFKTLEESDFRAETVLEILKDPENRIFLALVEGQPAGYIWAELVKRPETTLKKSRSWTFIHQISVNEDFRKMGLGQALMNKVKELALEEGSTKVVLDIWEFNERAKTFFTSNGFQNYNLNMWLNLEPDKN